MLQTMIFVLIYVYFLLGYCNRIFRAIKNHRKQQLALSLPVI